MEFHPMYSQSVETPLISTCFKADASENNEGLVRQLQQEMHSFARYTEAKTKDSRKPWPIHNN